MQKISDTDVINIVQNCFIDQGFDKTVDITTSARDTLEWDSLLQLNIIYELDERIGDKINGIVELAETTSVQGIIQLLQNNNLCEA